MKIPKLLAILAVSLVSISSKLPATELSHIPGAFLDIGYGARPMGMGGAFVGLADDRNAVLWNPAGLLKMDGSGVTFMWAKQMGFVPYNYFSYSRNLGSKGRLGMAAIYSGDEVMSETTALLSFARAFSEKISLGMNAKILMSSFGNNSDGDPDRITGDAFGYGMDLALMYRFSDKVSFGAILRDMYNDITWNNSTLGTEYSEATPMEFTLGASYRHSPNSVLAIDLRKALYEDVEDHIALGVEQRVFKFLLLRAGWGQNIGAKWRNQDIALGLGLVKQTKSFDFSFDFAYLLNDLKNTPRAGIALNW
jgi:hypothetical protein